MNSLVRCGRSATAEAPAAGPTRAGLLHIASSMSIEQPPKPDFPRPIDPIDSPPPDIKPVPPPDIPVPEPMPPILPERGNGPTVI